MLHLLHVIHNILQIQMCGPCCHPADQLLTGKRLYLDICDLDWEARTNNRDRCVLMSCRSSELHVLVQLRVTSSLLRWSSWLRVACCESCKVSAVRVAQLQHPAAPTPTPHSLDLKTSIKLLEILTCSQLDVDEISFLSAWQQQEGRLPILDRCQ